uniref:Uncharacterized protein n=1 Tax=Tanacetum cinerariifolium TaxID=118510 RepID=A0A699HNW0_TANCI|nr:hypothetical protein [Tanacetum cinerariifolium]
MKKFDMVFFHDSSTSAPDIILRGDEFNALGGRNMPQSFRNCTYRPCERVQKTLEPLSCCGFLSLEVFVRIRYVLSLRVGS